MKDETFIFWSVVLLVAYFVFLLSLFVSNHRAMIEFRRTTRLHRVQYIQHFNLDNANVILK